MQASRVNLDFLQLLHNKTDGDKTKFKENSKLYTKLFSVLFTTPTA